MNTPIPTGYVADHHAPTEWIVTCPDCEDRKRTQTVPDSQDRVCSECDRLKGVTPISRQRKRAPDGGRVASEVLE